jgi:hypothetical protein
VKNLWKLVQTDRQRSVQKLVQELNKDIETVRKILTADLGIREVLAKLVPQIVSNDHKQWQYDVCVDLSRHLSKGDNFLDKVLFIDNSG